MTKDVQIDRMKGRNQPFPSWRNQCFHQVPNMRNVTHTLVDQGRNSQALNFPIPPSSLNYFVSQMASRKLIIFPPEKEDMFFSLANKDTSNSLGRSAMEKTLKKVTNPRCYCKRNLVVAPNLAHKLAEGFLEKSSERTETSRNR